MNAQTEGMSPERQILEGIRRQHYRSTSSGAPSSVSEFCKCEKLARKCWALALAESVVVDITFSEIQPLRGPEFAGRNFDPLSYDPEWVRGSK